jgi:pyruvate dehydrogenase (quinone)
MANPTGADILMDTLLEWDVEVIFGFPGDGINGIMEALRIRQKEIRFVQVRHEEAAAFMACAYAKYTGKIGCCLATSGPGGVHLLNGLYDAKHDGQPVVAITGGPYHDLIHTFSQQDVELDKLFENVASYNVRVSGPAHVANVTHLACRSALASRSVSHITFPSDFQTQTLKVDVRTPRNRAKHNSSVPSFEASIPSPVNLKEAADLLNAGKKIVILAGRGALGAGAELEALAAKLGAPIVKPLLGKACVPDDSPFTTGGIGLLGTRPSQEAIEQADTMLMVGTSFPYIEFMPKPGQVKAVQIDMDPVRIGIRYPVDVGIVGDSRVALQQLMPLLEQHDQAFLQKAQAAMKDWNELMVTRGTVEGKPMKPQVVAHELNKLLKSDAIVSCDSGTITTWWARHIHVQRGQMHSVSGNLATMACGLPYTIAAQVAYPDRQCVAFVGDGGFTMLMGEFATAVKHKLPIKVVVIKNNTLGQIKWEQMVFLGNPEFACDLYPIDFVKIAEACGGRGFRIDDPANCAEILSEAMNTPGPVLIEAEVDQFTPPMPAKIEGSQAAHLAKSLARGEPHGLRIALTAVSDMVRETV